MRGSWSPKKARVSSSDRPFPSRPSENITSVGRHAHGVRLVELSVLVQQPHHRLGQHDRDGGGRQQQEHDRAYAAGHDPCQLDHVAHGGGARELGKQHGRYRHREQPLRQHEQAERVAQVARRRRAVVRRDDGVQGQVDVDQPQPQRDRHHQAQDVAHVRVPEAEPEGQPDPGAAQQRQRDQELHDRGHQHAPRVHLRPVLERAAAAVDQQHRDDHEVPGHRREGRDAEDPLRVEDAGDDAEQPHQHHDREQDPGQRHHQVGGDVAGTDQQHRHQQRCQQDEQGRDRAQHHRRRPQHHARRPATPPSPRPSRAAPGIPARRPR